LIFVISGIAIIGIIISYFPFHILASALAITAIVIIAILVYYFIQVRLKKIGGIFDGCRRRKGISSKFKMLCKNFVGLKEKIFFKNY